MAAPRLRLIPGGREDPAPAPRRSRRFIAPPPPKKRTRFVGPSLRPVDPDAPRRRRTAGPGAIGWAAVVMGMAGVAMATMGLVLIGVALLLAGLSVGLAPPGPLARPGRAPGRRRQVAGAVLMAAALALLLVQALGR